LPIISCRSSLASKANNSYASETEAMDIRSICRSANCLASSRLEARSTHKEKSRRLTDKTFPDVK
jgi:hypothetical protein